MKDKPKALQKALDKIDSLPDDWFGSRVDSLEFLEKDRGPLTLGRALKADRLAAEMTQEELASKISVTEQAIHGFESERDFPNYTTLKKLAEVFKMDESSYVRLLVQDLVRKYGVKGYTIEVKKK